MIIETWCGRCHGVQLQIDRAMPLDVFLRQLGQISQRVGQLVLLCQCWREPSSDDRPEATP